MNLIEPITYSDLLSIVDAGLEAGTIAATGKAVAMHDELEQAVNGDNMGGDVVPCYFIEWFDFEIYGDEPLELGA